ncbi:hypothetical protein GVN22_24190 [Cellulophaga sp. BC115SP]|nr:hypothetical protein [Cellulophaga sp. BC115SP]
MSLLQQEIKLSNMPTLSNNNPLSFVFESTATITRFRDLRDPKPRG